MDKVTQAVCLSALAVEFYFLPGLDTWWVRLGCFAGVACIYLFSLSGWRRAGIFGLAAGVIFVSEIGYGFYRYALLDVASYAESTWKVSELPEHSRPVVVHVSDAHFIGSDCGRTYEGAAWDERRVRKSVAKILELAPQFLIVSGDITDSGTETEWQQARSVLLDPVVKSGTQVVVAPGNHDLQNVFAPEGPFPTSKPKIQRFLEAAIAANSSLESSRKNSISDELNRVRLSEEREERQRAFLREQTACIQLCQAVAPGARSCAQGCADANANAAPEQTEPLLPPSRVTDACSEWYPVRYTSQDRRIAVLTLCSSAREAGGIGTNALGYMGQNQLKLLEDELKTLAPEIRHVFVVMHHSPVRRPSDRWGISEALRLRGESTFFHYMFLGNAIEESRRIVNALLSAADTKRELRAYLLFGHRHREFLGKIDNPYKDNAPWVWVSEAPALYDPAGGMWLAYELPGREGLTWRWWTSGDDTVGDCGVRKP